MWLASRTRQSVSLQCWPSTSRHGVSRCIGMTSYSLALALHSIGSWPRSAVLEASMTLPTSNGIGWLAWQSGLAVCPIVRGARGALSYSQRSFLHAHVSRQRCFFCVREPTTFVTHGCQCHARLVWKMQAQWLLLSTPRSGLQRRILQALVASHL